MVMIVAVIHHKTVSFALAEELVKFLVLFLDKLTDLVREFFDLVEELVIFYLMVRNVEVFLFEGHE